MSMAPSEVEKLMQELRTWVDAEYGRRADLARELDVPRQRITDWLSGRKAPTLEQGLTILAILAKAKLESMTRPVIPVIQPKNPQVVPVLNGPVRFAVVNSEAVTSNSWRCWAEQKGDVYIACRDNFKECKVSLHASGSWQMGFTEEGYKKCSHLLPENRIRHWQIWPKPLPIAPDVVMAFKLLFPSSELAVLPAKRRAAQWKDTVLIGAAPAAYMTVVNLSITKGQQLNFDPGPTLCLASLDMGNGRRAQLIVSWNPEGDTIKLIDRAVSEVLDMAKKAGKWSPPPQGYGYALGQHPEGWRFLVGARLNRRNEGNPNP
jgi:hypothetical protein